MDKYSSTNVTYITSVARYNAWLPRSVSRPPIALLASAGYYCRYYCRGNIKVNNATPRTLLLPQKKYYEITLTTQLLTWYYEMTSIIWKEYVELQLIDNMLFIVVPQVAGHSRRSTILQKIKRYIE